MVTKRENKSLAVGKQIDWKQSTVVVTQPHTGALKEGNFFGELAFCAGVPATASVYAEVSGLISRF